MRLIRLIICKMKWQIRTNPLLLTIFCLGSFICTLSVIMMYGNVMPHMIRETYEKYYRSFDVFLDRPVSVQQLDVMNTVYLAHSAYGIEDVIVSASLDSGKTSVKASLENRIFEEDSSGATFDLSSPHLQDQMILSEITASYAKKETFDLLGKTYSVVGVAKDNYLTYSEFHAQDFPVDCFRVILTTKPTSAVRKEYTQCLKTQFSGCRVRNADHYIAQDRELTVTAIGVMIGVYLLLFFALAYILYDILQSELYVHLVFHLHGATIRRLLCLIVGELLFLMTLVGSLACLLHYTLYETWFSSFQLYANVPYRWFDYVLIVLATDLTALCCVSPFLCKWRSKYSYQIKREATVF